MVVSLTFTIGFIIGLSSVSVEILTLSPIHYVNTLTENNIESNTGLFLSTLGNFAGEIVNPHKTYLIGVTISIFINAVSCTTAVIATLTPQRDESEITKVVVYDRSNIVMIILH